MKRIILFFAVCLGLSGIWTDGFCATNTSRIASKRTNANTTTIADKNLSRTTVKNRTTNARQQQKTVQNRQTNKNVKQRTASTSVQPRQSTTATRTATPRQTKTNNAVKSRTAASKTTAMATRATELNQDKIDSIKSKDYSKCKTVFFDCMDEFCANKDSNLRRCACSSRIHEFDGIKKQLSAAEDKMLDFNQRLLTVSLSKEDAAAINVASEGEQSYYDTKDKSESEKMLKKITDALNSSGNSRINNNLSSISLSLNVDSAWDSVDSMAGVATTSKSGVDLYNAARPVCIEMAKEVCSDDEISVVQSSYQLSIQQDCNTVAKSYSSQYTKAKEKIYESSALLDMARLNVYQTNNSDDILTCKKKILEQLSDSTVCGKNLYKCLDTTGKYINPSTGAAFLSTNLYNLTTLLVAPTGDLTWAKVPQNDAFVKFLNSKRAYLKTAVSQCQEMADVVWDDFINDALSQIKLAQNAKLEEIRQSCTTLVAQCKTGAQTSLNEFDARALSTFNVLSDTTVNKMCEQVQTSCTSLMASSGGGAEEWEKGMNDIAVDTSYAKIMETCMIAGKDCIIQKCNGTAGNFALCQDYSSSPRRSILNRNACWKDVYDCVKQSGFVDQIKPFYVQGIDDKTNMAGRRKQFYLANYRVNANNLPDGITSTITYFTDDADYDKVPTLCDDESDIACLITEQLWGNCHHDPAATAISTNSDLIGNNNIEAFNTILTPLSGSTLLAWFAEQTGTTTNKDSCSAYKCPANYLYDETTKQCKLLASGDENTEFYYFTGYQKTFTTMEELITTIKNIKNYCPGGAASKDIYKNCCVIDMDDDGFIGTVSDNGICIPTPTEPTDPPYKALFIQTITCDKTYTITDRSEACPGSDISVTEQDSYCGKYKLTSCDECEDEEDEEEETGTGENTTSSSICTNKTFTLQEQQRSFKLYCITQQDSASLGNTSLQCDGYYVLIDQYGNYVTPEYTSDGATNARDIYMFYQAKNNNSDVAKNICVYNGYDKWAKPLFNPDGGYTANSNNHNNCGGDSFPKSEEFIIQYKPI